MNEKIKGKKFEIEILESIKVPLYLLLRIRVVCSANEAFMVNNIQTNSGINCKILNINNVNGYDLLTDIGMKKGDEITGYIGFQKTNFSTNVPRLVFEGIKKKVKL